MNSQADVQTLYADHHHWLVNWLCYRIGCLDDANDLAQDTFVRVLGRPVEIAGLHRPRAWLATIAHALMVDHVRRRDLERAYCSALADIPEPEVPSAEDRVIILDVLARIDAMLHGLGPRIRSAFLHSGMAGPADIEACAAWRARDPMHEKVWQRIQTVDRQIGAVPDGAGSLACLTLEKTFSNRSTSRRHVLKIAAIGVAVIGSGLLIHRSPWQRRESHTTDPGIRQSIDLHDGSHLMLSSDTRIDIAYSPLRRMVRLKSGEVYIETGADTTSMWGRRGFWVETAHARLEAIGTRFSVCEETERTRLHVAEGAIAIQLVTGRIIVHAGETVRIDTVHNHIKRIDPLDHDPMAWIRGAIVARRMRLADFGEQLNRHLAMKVRVTKDVGDLRVSGVFQLEGPDALTRILNALASTLPIAVRREKDLIWVQ
ncbi:FecR domain-containing protein [Desulfosarcina variabilis]|uniref:FecR domain-containing protein n=1 Tax=Desulfosarcina variabilis TaxID=2300 RepID=UPI003AFAF92A